MKAEQLTKGVLLEKGSTYLYELKIQIGCTFRKKKGFVFTLGLEIGYLIGNLKLNGQSVWGSAGNVISWPYVTTGRGWQ